MGVDFTATFGHSMSLEQVVNFKNELNNSMKYKVFKEFSEKFPNYKAKIDNVDTWAWDDRNFTCSQDPYQKLGMLCGVGFFIIRFSKYLFSVHHTLRWYGFFMDQSIQYEMRKICKLLGSEFGNAIYLPDSHSAHDLFYENKTMGELKEYLFINYGDPVIISNGLKSNNNSNSYYIDDFLNSSYLQLYILLISKMFSRSSK